jgi:hypothetical protein
MALAASGWTLADKIERMRNWRPADADADLVNGFSPIDRDPDSTPDPDED